MPAMPFGKHRGQDIKNVPTDYLRWLDRAGVFTSKDPYMAEVVKAELRHRAVHGERRDACPPPPQSRAVGVDAAAIQRWFARMAKKYHPDRGGSDEAMRAINDAFQELKKELGL